ncbi:hypothetical protein C8Q77DRAFT_468050 [Trametes polyzona]|nr:hypothetical protein C8Q77DRAFT_468050 [Trametes polyzona]
MNATSASAPTGVSAPQDVMAPPALPALDNTYGAMLLGAAFGFMLYGLTVHQTYRYSRLYPKDATWMKGLVASILALETLHTTTTLIGIYFHLITNYFNPPSLAMGHWSTRLITPTTGITIVLCQSFYAYRVYVIGPNFVYRALVATALVCMVVEFGFTMAATVEGFRLPLADFKEVSWLVSAMFGFAVFVDVCLTGTLVMVLLRSRTGFKRTDSLIEVLIVYSINTGLLTSIFGLLCFIFAIILPGNLIYIGISIVGVKLYANSVLAVLNSRRALSDRQLEGFEMSSTVESSRDRPNANTWKAREVPVSLAQTNTEIVFSSVQAHSITTDTTGLNSTDYGKRGETDFA